MLTTAAGSSTCGPKSRSLFRAGAGSARWRRWPSSRRQCTCSLHGTPANCGPTLRQTGIGIVALLDRLTTQGVEVHPAIGASPDGDHYEESYATTGLERTAAIDLGREFEQAAVFQLTTREQIVVGCEGDWELSRRLVRRAHVSVMSASSRCHGRIAPTLDGRTCESSRTPSRARRTQHRVRSRRFGGTLLTSLASSGRRASSISRREVTSRNRDRRRAPSRYAVAEGSYRPGRWQPPRAGIEEASARCKGAIRVVRGLDIVLAPELPSMARGHVVAVKISPARSRPGSLPTCSGDSIEALCVLMHRVRRSARPRAAVTGRLHVLISPEAGDQPIGRARVSDDSPGHCVFRALGAELPCAAGGRSAVDRSAKNADDSFRLTRGRLTPDRKIRGRVLSGRLVREAAPHHYSDRRVLPGVRDDPQLSATSQ